VRPTTLTGLSFQNTREHADAGRGTAPINPAAAAPPSSARRETVMLMLASCGGL
jgi:hypothetical protein